MPQLSFEFSQGPGNDGPVRPTADTLTKAAVSRFILAALAALALYSAPATAQYNFSDHWRLEVSGAYSPKRASHVGSQDTHFGLTTINYDNGVTANLGIWTNYVKTNLFCDVAVRCWYLDRVVSSSSRQDFKTPETTADLGCWC
jgi:hypothetical protein